MSIQGTEPDLFKKFGDLLEKSGLPRDATFGQLEKHLGIEGPQPIVINPVPSHLKPISEGVKESMSEQLKWNTIP